MTLDKCEANDRTSAIMKFQKLLPLSGFKIKVTDCIGDDNTTNLHILFEYMMYENLRDTKKGRIYVSHHMKHIMNLIYNQKSTYEQIVTAIKDMNPVIVNQMLL